MSFARVTFTYTGGPQVFSTNFALGVLEIDHLTVAVDGELDGLGNQIYRAFEYDINTGAVTITDPLPNPCEGVIQRSVPLDSLVVDFEQGDDVTKRNLSRSVKQTLMAVQEAADDRAEDSALIAQTVSGINDLTESIEDDVVFVATTAQQVSDNLSASNQVLQATQTVFSNTENVFSETQDVKAETGLIRDEVNAALALADPDTIVRRQSDGRAINVAEINDIRTTGFYRATSQTTDRPGDGPWVGIMHIQFNSTTALQYAQQLGNTIPRVFVRNMHNEEWSDWDEVVRTDMVQRASAGQVQSLANMDRLLNTATLRESLDVIQVPTGPAQWTPFWEDFINSNWVLAGNRTLTNPNSPIVGTTRVLRVVGNNTVGRTMSFGSNYVGDLFGGPITNTRSVLYTLYCATPTEIWVSAKEAQ